MISRTLKTVDEVIDAVGGTSAAARLTERKPNHVSNWRAEKRIAAETFLMFKAQLTKQKLKAPSSLWGIREAIKSKRKAKAS